MAEIQAQTKRTTLTLQNRELLNLTGIEDVLSFDEMSIYLITGNGKLLIEGSDLRITVLDVSSGNITIEGFVCAILYNDKETSKKGGFFAKAGK